jgi:hypothetical protein
MANPSAPSGKSEKYARPEWERRWLLARPPAPDGVAWQVEITDHYLIGTRLRLRRSTDPSGRTPTIYKFTQKVPGTGAAPTLVTNTYLNPDEYDLLRRLGGDVITKTRSSVPPLGVDVFHPPLHGLVIAEAEFESEAELVAFDGPVGAVAEITADQRLSGGRLVCTTSEELAGLLAEYGLP